MKAKGYLKGSDYMGWVGDHYQKFESEGAYDEWCAENGFSW